jgi:hypothetical protein
VRFLDGEIVLALAMLLALGMGVLAITTQVSENCKPTGETRPMTSFILVGTIAVPYTFEQPVYKCSEKKSINDRT